GHSTKGRTETGPLAGEERAVNGPRHTPAWERVVTLDDHDALKRELAEERDRAKRLAAELEAWLAWAAKNQANLYLSDLPESSFTQLGDLVVTSRAALARVKGGER